VDIKKLITLVKKYPPMPVITYQLIQHKNQDKILILFEPNAAWNKRIQKVAGVRWSKSYGGWTIPDTEINRQKCGLAQATPALIKKESTVAPVIKSKQVAATGIKTGKTALSYISDANKEELKKFLQQLVLKAYSPSTIRTYRNEFGTFLQTLGKHAAEKLTVQRIKDYLQYCHTQLKLSENTLHSRINAMKFYYEQVLKKEKFFWEIPRPNKPVQLPHIFNQDEITAIINSVTNKKHKVMLMLAYSGGLRVSEVVTIKTNNIDSKRMTIFISRAKGKKDRIVTLSPVLLVMLREYALQYKPDKKGYLFAGSTKGSSYSARSLQEVIQAAKNKAGVMKPGSIHSLRHSFATHLIEKGTDVTMIQKLLGHNDIRTTLRYLHTSNKDLLKIISPLDDLDLT